MIEVTNPAFSRLEFMELVSKQINMPRSELECLMDMPAFSPYSDAHCVENDD